MAGYILKRLMLMFLMMPAITLVVFLIISIGTANIKSERAAEAARVTQRRTSNPRLTRLRMQFGKDYPDSPLVTQYWNWMENVVHGDFGRSLTNGRPVLEKLLAAMPITIVLNVITIFLVYALAIPLGIFSATHRNSKLDDAITVLLYLLYSLPTMWVAILLIRWFGAGPPVGLGLLPYHGITPDGADGMTTLQRLWHTIPYLVLPVIVMTYGAHAYLSRISRVGMIDVISRDYIRTARAKGLSEHTVIYKHALRNSVIPLVTILAGLLPSLFGGSVIIEVIFGIPGMGMLGYEAVMSKDLTLIMTVTTFAAFLTLLGILFSDIAYALVDPRITFERREA